MSRIRRGIVLIAVFLAMLALPVPPVLAQAQPEGPVVRVAHLSPDAPNVDVYVNDRPVEALTNLPFGTVSPYASLLTGRANIKIFAAGSTSELLWETDVEVRPEAICTLGILGEKEDGSLNVAVYESDWSQPLAEGTAELHAVHAAPNVGPATVSTGSGQELLTLPGFSNMSRGTAVQAGGYDLRLGAAGSDEQALSLVPNATLEAGEHHTLFVAGRAEDGSLSAILTADSEGGATINTVGAVGNTGSTAGGSTNNADNAGGGVDVATSNGQYADEAQYGGASTAPQGETLAQTGGSSPLAVLPATHGVLVLIATIGLLARWWWRSARGGA